MFKTAINYLATYREKRAEALRNKQRQRWFASDVAELPVLFTDVFSSDAENADWAALAAKPSDRNMLQSVRTKIALLAGFRHDLRNQFAAGDDHRAKTEADLDRHTIGQLLAARFRLAMLDADLEVRKQGVNTI